ncbi:Calcium permeable stress-gated cation channel 1 [Labeo rohita]|uniref:Calcium permeable stress-gated cation channel 1 n=1 Tax=Labeo rohita TaxID=84645 RepID=A0ABQ8LY58_LABRO|nr:Calcium permeable stress-gated cation channel 1 [Labeo rohita]
MAVRSDLWGTAQPAFESWPAGSGSPVEELDVRSFLSSLMEENSTAERCYRSHSRSSVLQGLPFGGVPTVLTINVVLWLFLLLIFSCLRKAAWDYGRLALLMENDSLTSLFYGEQSEKEKTPSESSPSDSETKDMGFCSWLTSLYHMKDEEIRSKCGIDAITYLSFQRHIILLMTVVCLLSLTIILPVNLSGNLLGDSPQNFGRTTVVNVPAQNTFLWLHSIFALLYFYCAWPIIHHDWNTERMRSEAYPSCTVTDIRFCFDVQKLMKLDLERRKAMKGRLYFTTKSQKDGRIMIKTHPCAQIFCCDICGFEQVDAEQYYSELEEKLTDEFNAEKNRISMKRLGIAFVTFRDERMTAVRARCRHRPQQSSITTVVRSHQWGVSYAPAPNDIIWENLSVCGSRWWLRCVLLNILLFLLLFFLTTPAIIVNTMDKFNVTRPVESLRNPVITQFFPTLLLWAFSILLPFIVYYSSFFEYHWTRSGENQVTMHKCFLLLVFMVIILPSLGLSRCVFLPDNGAFFVNYVVTSSLIGTAMELLRIPALLYAWTMCIFSVSMTYSITCPIIVPFVLISTSVSVLIPRSRPQSVCGRLSRISNSISVSRSVHFAGLLYLVLKHLVDRYNIYYAYLPTKLSQRIHSAAISQVVVAPILCMFWLLFFSVLRLGPVQPITLFTFITLLCCIAFSCFGFCLKKLRPDRSTSYQMSDQTTEGGFTDAERSTVSTTTTANLFIASVLLEPELGLTPMPSPAHQSYGTMGNSQSSVRDAEGVEEKDLEETLETELKDDPDPSCPSPLMDSPVGFQ